MSIAPAERARARREPPAKRFVKPGRAFSLGPEARASAALYLVSFLVYTAVGVQVVVRKHVVVFDGMARLSHAFFVWWNAPPKLAAIGFVWPPVATLVYLPFALVRPLATSLVAMPVIAAAFGAGLILTLDRVFRLVGMRRSLRLPLLAAFGLDPMILFYASNGMSEIVYLFFLSLGVYFFLRWYLDRAPSVLILSALFLALATLSRYEVISWAFLLIFVLIVALIRQHVSRAELEGSMLAYVAPISYGIGLWLFFNWLILGDPLFWLRHQAPGAAANGPAGQAIAVTAPGPSISAWHIASSLVQENLNLFVLAPLTLVALLVLAVRRRDVMALAIALMIGLNAFFTGLLVYVSHAESYLQLRYNMRAMPLAMIGVAWLYLRVAPRARIAVWAAALAIIVTSWPLTWNEMRTFPYQYLEQAFTRVLSTGKDQEGTASVGGYRVGIAGQKHAAAWVVGHIHGKNEILTDDAQTFSVMLLSGRPDLFWDRIDKGDEAWLDVLSNPWGRVRYMLVSSGVDDLIRAHYPAIADGTVPGFTVVHRGDGFTVVAVAPRPPQPKRPS